ncbi:MULTISPECIES: rhomboid family intramembrane serine protease [Flavobacterium]|uniref:rhomboid family intramembrane serine protease n=1 Tax=Flavobacterium TaxID=237 RepID=UPI001FCA9AAC|nr:MULTISPECIES: rhomboid family intramembrane serine protease [Flavobacterium]UOK43865.1 rhomboid family intramembrane serine protease [Flavobacterium enshiense]
MMNMTETVKQLIIINVLLYVGTIMVPAALDFLPMFYFENPSFKVWQVITHMFMHAPFPNFMHVLFNMFALYSFGSSLEHFWGGRKFLFFYISCGLGAMLLHNAINYFAFHSIYDTMINSGLKPSEISSFLDTGSIKYNAELIRQSDLQSILEIYNGRMLGASGAIYGLLVAFAFMFPNAGLALIFLPVPVKAKYFVPGLLLLDLFLGVKGNSIFGGGTGIAHFAHIGGAIIGFIMMSYWKKNQFNNNRWN